MAATETGGASTSGSGSSRPSSESVYVVQVQRKIDVSLGENVYGDVAWEDVATVSVPARTKRRAIIGRALAESGVKPDVGGDPLKVRVLDASSAHVTEVAAVQPDPQLEIR